jgi:hypothetical protein
MTSRKGILLCTDTCDPSLLSVEDYRYFISFIDVYSRFSTSYMLQIKSDSEAALRAFISYLRAMGFFLQKIRSDRRGEFDGANYSPSISGGDAPRDDDSLIIY